MTKSFFTNHLREVFFFSLFFSAIFFAFSVKRVQWLCPAKVSGEFATIYAKEKGFIKYLNAKEGDSITKGFMLFGLDDAFLKTEMKQKQKQIQQIKKQAEQQKSQVDQLTQEYISLRSEFEREKLKEEDLKAHLDHLTKAQKNYEQFLSDLDDAVSENELLTTRLHQKQIFAPIKGMVVKKWKNIGEEVHPSDPVFSICNLDKVWIDACVSEEVFSKLYQSQEVIIQPSAFSKATLKGKIIFFGIGEIFGKDKKVKIPIKVSIPSSSEVVLRPGMSVRLGV